MKIDSSQRLRLGPLEVNIKTGEIRTANSPDGTKGAFLQEKSLRVLRMLMENQGELVLREEIQKALWPNDTVVDFDHGIHVAVATLRRALGDSATSPQFIETVPRRGYRLLVPIEEAGPDRSPEPVLGPGDDSSLDQNGRSGLAGKWVSHFRVLAILGAGGMGTVYEAEDTKLGRRVALKVLPEEMADDPAALRRFEREARTTSSLNHHNICTIFAVEEFERQPVIVMELLEGETLRDRLARVTKKPISLDELLDIALQTCDGLAAAHSGGIIHRDIKPANLFLISSGQSAKRWVKILDFGLAKLMLAEPSNDAQGLNATAGDAKPNEHLSAESDISMFRPGGAAGTASYMSPEQIRRDVLDARTDLFSFGLVLYEMATGQRAFPGDDPAKVREALLNEEPIPVGQLNPSIPAALEAVIATALQKDRAARYQSAQEMRTALESVGRLPRRQGKLAMGLIATAIVLFAAVSIAAYWRYRARFQLAANDAIVIADITNQTSDSVLSDAVNVLFPVEFKQTPYFQVLEQDKVAQTLQTLGYAPDAAVTPDVARKVCLKTNSRAVITSTIADKGNRFYIQLAAVNCQTGTVFAKAQADAATRNQIMHVLGIAGADLRGAAGEPRSSVARFNTPLDQAASPSLEALQLFSQAIKRYYSTDNMGPIPLLERAVQIDPSFALAYSVLGISYERFGRHSEAMNAEAVAYRLRDHLNGPNKYLAETLYYDLNFGDLEAEYPVFEQWISTFPYDGVGHTNFAVCLFRLGQYERAAVEARQAIHLLPKLSQGGYIIAMRAMVALNRLDEAKAIYDEAVARRMVIPLLHEDRELVAFLEHDEAEIDRQIQHIKAGYGLVGDMYEEARIDDSGGQFERARALLRRAPESKDKADLSNFALNSALQEAESGETIDARRILAAQNNVPEGLRDLGALAFARAGDVQHAEFIAGRINAESPRNTLIQHFTLPSIRAAILLDRNDPAGAIQALKAAEGYELAYPEKVNDVYPAYLRGLAFLKLNDGQAAANEFKKLIAHPGIIGRDVLSPLAWLQLGRAQKMAGDIASARRSYSHFLEVWRHADPDVPIYRQAKAEFAKLPSPEN